MSAAAPSAPAEPPQLTMDQIKRLDGRLCFKSGYEEILECTNRFLREEFAHPQPDPAPSGDIADLIEQLESTVLAEMNGDISLLGTKAAAQLRRLKLESEFRKKRWAEFMDRAEKAEAERDALKKELDAMKDAYRRANREIYG